MWYTSGLLVLDVALANSHRNSTDKRHSHTTSDIASFIRNAYIPKPGNLHECWIFNDICSIKLNPHFKLLIQNK